ncbi:FYN-binding protein 1 [Osmerus mordax]|uniref:FYN-binding protein 1 n=1 Tax=Osmerus mordax TaxID=8014 RepID=UPI00350EFB62
MKKKFKIKGQEEAMYQATVTVTTKGRKDDLALNSGDIISIIRTTNCPKGKWLARDSSNTFGYVSVSHVELDVKEMMELGKKAVGNRKTSTLESERTSTGSRNSNNYPLSTGSFSDDSEEWTGDDEEMFSSPTASTDPGLDHTTSIVEEGSREPSVHHEHTASDVSTDSVNQQARHEALHKLSTFFHEPRDTSPPAVEEQHASPELETSPEVVAAEQAQSSVEEVDSLLPDMIILPPPDLYADINFAE